MVVDSGSSASRLRKNKNKASFYLRTGKGMFDRAAALAGLVLFSPLFLVVAVAVKLDSPGPVFFGHKRVGRNFIPFKVLKFRSMVCDASRTGPAITRGGDPRITRVGKVLRASKIDELPQLVNVLLGQMSLVGPRPEVARYVEMFAEDYREILTVCPGITDYAALEFRDEEALLQGFKSMEDAYINIIMPAKISLYKKYISRIGFCEDLRILMRTFFLLLRR